MCTHYQPEAVKRGRARTAELLAWLQLGMCGACGRALYYTRREARHAARIASPGRRLRAYQCGEYWHLASPAGQPQVIASPVTLHPRQALRRRGLDLDERGERRCPDRPTPAGPPARTGNRRRTDHPTRAATERAAHDTETDGT